MSGSVAAGTDSHGRSLDGVEEVADVVGETIWILEKETVAAVGVDRKLRAGDLARVDHRIDRRKGEVEVAVGD